MLVKCRIGSDVVLQAILTLPRDYARLLREAAMQVYSVHPYRGTLENLGAECSRFVSIAWAHYRGLLLSFANGE